MTIYKSMGIRQRNPRRTTSSSIRRALTNVKYGPRVRVGSKTAVKTHRSVGTQTMTKRSIFEKVRHDGPMSNSFHRWTPRLKYVKLPKAFEMITAPQFYVANAVGRLTNPVGKQAFLSDSGPALWSPTDLTNIYTQASLSSVTTAGGSTVGGYTPNVRSQKIMLKSCTSELMITNQTNDVVNLKIYDCVARRDIKSADFWNPGLAWVTGTTAQGIAAQSTIVGSNPFQTPGFTNFWLVEKVFDINLHTGGHHVHRSKSVVHFPLDRFVLEQVGESLAAIQGLTRWSLVVIHGYPGNDVTTVTQVSTNAGAVDMVWSKQYQYQVFEKSSTFSGNSNTLPPSYTVAESIINDQTGAAATLITA